MGIVIDFPAGERLAQGERLTQGGRRGGAGELAMVVILPVIRVERLPDAPRDGVESGTRGAGRKRRRRASRS
jgi:hypothetical protein